MRVWQRMVVRWCQLVFRERYEEASTPTVRFLRLLEEVVELGQAENVHMHHVAIIVNQVYSRPPGAVRDELGGVMITLAGYADAAGLDMEEAFWTEFERIMDPAIMEKVRHRNLSGDKIGMRPGEFLAGNGLMDGV